MGKEGCHSRESGNPVFDFIQIFEILDARSRLSLGQASQRHDEL
jgi:hypothetical protein